MTAHAIHSAVTISRLNAIGTVNLLEATRVAACGARFYQASSSEMFGKVREVPQSEQTPFYPRSPYGVSKVFGHYTTMNFREAYDIPRDANLKLRDPRGVIAFATPRRLAVLVPEVLPKAQDRTERIKLMR